MKDFARFLVFLGLCFIVMFAGALGITLLHSWISAASHVPATDGISLQEFAAAAHWALPFTLYLAIIFSIDYGRRHRIASPLVFILVASFAAVFTFCVSASFENLNNMADSPVMVKHSTLGRPGLMLSRPGVIITMLDQPSNETGSRVVSMKGQPLIYQKLPIGADGAAISLPNIPFRGKEAWFSNSVMNDLAISGHHISERFSEGRAAFLSWVLSLVFLLVALGFIAGLSSWPLANVFLGILAFRGILAFEVFLNSDGVMDYIKGFTRGVLPDMFIAPAIMAAGAVLLLIYSLLLFLARISR